VNALSSADAVERRRRDPSSLQEMAAAVHSAREQFAGPRIEKETLMKRILIAMVVGLIALNAFADDVDVPVIDLPYNAAHGVRGPSMQQSLGLTAAFYDLSTLEIERLTGNHKLLGKTTTALFDVATLSVPFPFTDVWLHEEWHRAVMGNRGINSFNDVYRFDAGGDAINVSHVRDEDLIRLKRDHPSELVRLDEAGIEGEHALVQRLEKERFFSDARAWHLPLYWLVKFSTQAYLGASTSNEVNTETDDANRTEGANVPKRDFTGWDFTGWMYDLSRPNEPYEARGIHPSGVGINRYRKTTDLTPHELAFLHRQGQLHLLNFADTNLVGIDSFGPRSLRWNVTAGHLLTSFGYTIDANVFLRTPDHKLFVVAHRYANDVRSFPGLEAQLIDEPITFRGRELRVTPRLALWMQPDQQLFRSKSASPGGLAALRIEAPSSGRFGQYVEVEGKSTGWVSGSESVGRSIAIRVGVTSRIGSRS
jgi:hypothetical protein